MQRESQTQFAVLGLLELGPMSGYDLKQMVDGSIGHFWSEGWGRIYPTLASLEKAGMVTKRTERKRGRPERKVYSLRPAGKKQLRTWLCGKPAREVRRNELLLKLFFGRAAPAGVNRAHVESFARQCAEEIVAYQQVLRMIEKEHAAYPDAPFWKITVSHGMHVMRALEHWSEETLAALERVESGVKAERERKRERDTQ